MVTGVEQEERPASDLWGPRPERVDASPAADRLLAEIPKCPYLAGRPPCGTHHLFPSGTNVCWADPGAEKPYRAISRDTQARHCFGGPEGQSECERYQNAVAASLRLPEFERHRPAAETADGQPGSWADTPFGSEKDRSSRRRSRPREHDSRRLLTRAAWLVPLVLIGVLLALLLR